MAGKKEGHGKVLAIIPCLNEGKVIGNVVRKTLPFVTRVLVVDDGSQDDTMPMARKAGAIAIRHRHNKGAGAAIRTGIFYALKHSFPICVVMGGDDQDDPSQIPLLLTKLRQGHDLVQGSRYLKGGRTVDIPLFRLVTTKIYSIFFSIVMGKRITDGTNGFRAFRTSICSNPRMDLRQQWLDRYELEPYLLFKAIQLGYDVTEAPVTKSYPEGAYTKMDPLRDYWSILRPLVFLRLGLKK